MHKLWPNTAKKPHSGAKHHHHNHNQSTKNGGASVLGEVSESGKLEEKLTSSMSDDGQSTADGSIQSGDPNKKTPMCLINELAKYNKVLTEIDFKKKFKISYMYNFS